MNTPELNWKYNPDSALSQAVKIERPAGRTMRESY